MTNKSRIIIATGGTGGHIFPAVALSDHLKNKFEVEMFSDKRGMKYLKKEKNIKQINTETIFQKNIIKSIINLNKILFSTISSFFYLKKKRPIIVFGMGGYSSFPVCLASYFLKIPFVIYENNLILGRANRVLLPFANKILLSTKDTSGIKQKYKNKIFVSGYLLRKEIFDIKKEKSFENNRVLSILIIGGSQSAKIFGEQIPKVIEQCKIKKIEFNIFQQCLDSQKKEIEEIYRKNQINYKLFSFSDNLTEHYKNSDMAITRAGASSLAELINLRIPFIAIPLPSSADNHQLKNAQNFEKKGYCRLLDEKFVTSKLSETLEDFNKNRKKLFLIRTKMDEHSDKNSIYSVGKFIEKLLNEKN